MLTPLVFPTRDSQQSHRMRRWIMASGASGMVVVLFFAAYLLGLLELRHFLTAASLVLSFVILFYVIFRSNLNLRFRDPSLTLAQILASTLVILYVLSRSEEGHGILSLIYMVSFLFGVFRLSTRELLGITAFVSLSYGLIIAVQWQADIVSAPHAFNRKVLNWIVLTSVLTFFSVMGGYISKLRKTVADSKAELEKALLRIEYMAARDELTDLVNRRSLVDSLKQQKSRADRFGSTFTTLMLDIDFFKRVNDTHGHQAGDVVLQIFAKAASASLRATDVLGRYGGEEFMALLDQTPLERSAIVAERLCSLARNLNFDELAIGLRISISIGAAEYRRPEEWQATIERADQALYRAKHGGRDRFELDNSTDDRVVRGA